MGTVALSTTGPETKVTAATSTKAAGSDEDHPNGQAFVGPAGGPVPPSADTIDAGHAHPEDGTDACACDAPVTGDEVTDDSELPPSYGGVEGGDTLVGGQ